jgi:CRISPR/Cas system-associated endonuclease/helicase Cas3
VKYNAQPIKVMFVWHFSLLSVSMSFTDIINIWNADTWQKNLSLYIMVRTISWMIYMTKIV